MPQSDIVMISVDDLFNIDRVRDMFGVEIQTPNFDRLKAMGVTFENAYASVALCNPSRTSILTGLNPFETGVQYNTETWYDKVDPTTTLPALMQQGGYTTMSFGKNFHTIQMPANISGQMFDTYYAPPGDAYDFDSAVRWGVLPGDPNATGDAMSIAAALNSLNSYAGTNPLFMMVGLVDPHAPFTAPQWALDLYPLDQIVVPQWDGDQPPAFLLQYLWGQTLADLRASGELASLVQGYLANISEMDARLGQLLDGIEASGRNPSIVLFSDHGYSLGDHDTLHKFTLWEQGSNAPLIVVTPDHAGAGTVNDGVVSFLDIAPTILDMAGLDIPARMEGQSLLPSVNDAGVPTVGIAVTTMAGSFSIRTQDYRYTRYEDGTVELYDCRVDLENKHNLHGDPAYATDEASLASLLETTVAGMGVTWDSATNVTVYETASGDTQYFLVDPAILSTLSDSQGIDTVYAGAGTVLLPDWAENFIAFSHDPYTITGNDLDNLIGGESSADLIYGQGGNDTVHALFGNDTVHGGAGNDFLDGGPQDDLLYGDDGADRLRGSLGSDTLHGGAGNDTLTGDEANDVLNGNAGADRLDGGIGDDLLFGNADNDTLIGGDGNDSLNGGSGADRMVGGAGDDVYIVDNAGDVIIEAAGGGIDTVRASITERLAANVENLTLIGTGSISGTGNDLDNVIIGNDQANTLSGGAGNDTLDGHGGGGDRMLGGTGDDVFYVDDAYDMTIENAGEGTDTVFSSISETLLANVENLTLIGGAAIDGTGNDLDNAITGNSQGNRLSGGAGSDSLDGGGGRDTLTGGVGADHFIYTHAATGPTRVNLGVITDFSHADGDVVDLSGLYAGTLSYLGAGAFTGAAGELRVVNVAAGQQLQVDVDGGGADMIIVIRGGGILGPGDLLL